MFYFTIFHWIAIAIFAVIFILLVLISIKEQNPKTKIAMIFSSVLVVLLGVALSLLALEKWTKKAKLLSYNNKRDLMNESIVFTGRLKNIGDFKIGYCKVEAKLTNNVYKMGIPKNSFFKPKNTLSSLFGTDKEAKPNVVKKEFVVAKNIHPKEARNFSIKMKYPPYFNNTSEKLTLTCH